MCIIKIKQIGYKTWISSLCTQLGKKWIGRLLYKPQHILESGVLVDNWEKYRFHVSKSVNIEHSGGHNHDVCKKEKVGWSKECTVLHLQLQAFQQTLLAQVVEPCSSFPPPPSPRSHPYPLRNSVVHSYGWLPVIWYCLDESVLVPLVWTCTVSVSSISTSRDGLRGHRLIGVWGIR